MFEKYFIEMNHVDLKWKLISQVRDLNSIYNSRNKKIMKWNIELSVWQRPKCTKIIFDK